jgi:hypothetical protein
MALKILDVSFPEEPADLIDKKFVGNSVAAVTFCVLPLFVTYGQSSNSRRSCSMVRPQGPSFCRDVGFIGI